MMRSRDTSEFVLARKCFKQFDVKKATYLPSVILLSKGSSISSICKFTAWTEVLLWRLL